MWHYEKTVLTKRTHLRLLLQSRFPGPRPTRLSNPAARVSTAARVNTAGCERAFLCVCVTKMAEMCHGSDAKVAAGDRPNSARTFLDFHLDNRPAVVHTFHRVDRRMPCHSFPNNTRLRRHRELFQCPFAARRHVLINSHGDSACAQGEPRRCISTNPALAKRHPWRCRHGYR